MSPLSGQTIAYQFSVSDSFDGTTLAENPEQSGDEDQFYASAQAESGLFPVNDPSPTQALTSRGDRWVTWLELRLDAPGSPGDLIEIVDNTSIEGTVLALKLIRDLEGVSLVYIDRGFLIPQGSVLRVRAGRGVLRYHVTFLDPQGLALLASLSVLPDASAVAYTPIDADWVAPAPDNSQDAITRIAASLAGLLGGPIPL